MVLICLQNNFFKLNFVVKSSPTKALFQISKQIVVVGGHVWAHTVPKRSPTHDIFEYPKVF